MDGLKMCSSTQREETVRPGRGGVIDGGEKKRTGVIVKEEDTVQGIGSSWLIFND